MNTRDMQFWIKKTFGGLAPESLTPISKSIHRFNWDKDHAIGIPSNAVKTNGVHAVVDGLAWWIDAGRREVDVKLLIGCNAFEEKNTPAMRETLDAIGSLSHAITDGPPVDLWLIDPEQNTEHVDLAPATFPGGKPELWASQLETASKASPEGMAQAVVASVDHEAFALYPKLSELGGTQPWQMRLDGIDIGRIGVNDALLALDSKDLEKSGTARDAWREVVGSKPRRFTDTQLAELAGLVHKLAERWHAGDNNPLNHGQAEHALEAQIVSGRRKVPDGDGATTLAPAVPMKDGVTRSAQFPTLWGSTGSTRYLDALMCDGDHRPVALELKAAGKHGEYFRHGLTQAVLYRHYIREVDALETWFADAGLTRSECRAALAFPKVPAKVELAKLKELALMFDVPVVEL